jgi:predicted transcriptional regulator
MDDDRINIAADIVSAYVSNNSVSHADLPKLIADVHKSLTKLGQGGTVEVPEPVKLEPAVPIKKSVTPDYIISLEDGKKFKSLKRHLSTAFNMTPDEYRAKWGLPSNYPMVAPNYAQARSELAKQSGLGQARKAPRANKVANAR